MRKQLQLPGLGLAALGAIAFSGKAIIVKLAYRYGVDAVTLIMYRMLFALPLFALMAWWSSRGKPPLKRRDWIGVLGLGFSGYYLASFLDFAGLAHVSASLERLILYLTPTLVLLRPWSAAGVAPEVIWLSVLNATLCTAVPVLLVMMAIERIGASATAQAGMVGPMSTILMGVLVLGEPFTAWVAVGTVLVVAGVYVFGRSARPDAG